MHNYESLGFFDFEDFVEELTDEQLFAINGGACAGGAPSGGHGPTGGGSCGGGFNPGSTTPTYAGQCSGGGAVTPSYPTPTSGCGGGYNPPKSPNNDEKNGNKIDDYTNPDTWLIVYDTDRKVIRVYNTDPETFKMALNDPYSMAKQLKENYKNEAGGDFPVSTGSLAAEIYMHAALYSANVNKSHTDVADCGANDSERYVYDLFVQKKGWK